MKIRIIADNPEDGQDSIKNFIGQEFEVKRKIFDVDNKFTGRVQIDIENDGFLSIIQPDEYEVVTE